MNLEQDQGSGSGIWSNFGLDHCEWVQQGQVQVQNWFGLPNQLLYLQKIQEKFIATILLLKNNGGMGMRHCELSLTSCKDVPLTISTLQ
jgi:hypothetical protein